MCIPLCTHIHIFTLTRRHTDIYTHVSAERSPATVWPFGNSDRESTVSHFTLVPRRSTWCFKKHKSQIGCLSSFFLKKRLTKLVFLSQET